MSIQSLGVGSGLDLESLVGQLLEAERKPKTDALNSREENVEAEIPISVKLIKPNQKYFLLRASGDSMNEAGINDGDLVLIKQQQTANNKDLVVALIDDEATIKELNKSDNMIVLKPKSNNNIHQPIILTSDFRVQGVVETVIPI